jgi:hypothetical protein
LPVGKLLWDCTVDFDLDHTYQQRYGEVACRADVTLTAG